MIFARIISTVLVFSALIFSGLSAEARTAAHFMGAYPIVSPPPSGDTEYLIVDNDTLEVIWNKYAETTLPPDLVQYKDLPVILAGFTNRNFLILAFEDVSTIGERYLKLLGSGDDLLELYRRDDGRYDMGTREDGIAQIYLLDVPYPLPSPVRKTILINHLPRLQRI